MLFRSASVSLHTLLENDYYDIDITESYYPNREYYIEIDPGSIGYPDCFETDYAGSRYTVYCNSIEIIGQKGSSGNYFGKGYYYAVDAGNYVSNSTKLIIGDNGEPLFNYYYSFDHPINETGNYPPYITDYDNDGYYDNIFMNDLFYTQPNSQTYTNLYISPAKLSNVINSIDGIGLKPVYYDYNYREIFYWTGVSDTPVITCENQTGINILKVTPDTISNNYRSIDIIIAGDIPEPDYPQITLNVLGDDCLSLCLHDYMCGDTNYILNMSSSTANVIKYRNRNKDIVLTIHKNYNNVIRERMLKKYNSDNDIEYIFTVTIEIPYYKNYGLYGSFTFHSQPENMRLYESDNHGIINVLHGYEASEQLPKISMVRIRKRSEGVQSWNSEILCRLWVPENTTGFYSLQSDTIFNNYGGLYSENVIYITNASDSIDVHVKTSFNDTMLNLSNNIEKYHYPLLINDLSTIQESYVVDHITQYAYNAQIVITPETLSYTNVIITIQTDNIALLDSNGTIVISGKETIYKNTDDLLGYSIIATRCSQNNETAIIQFDFIKYHKDKDIFMNSSTISDKVTRNLYFSIIKDINMGSGDKITPIHSLYGAPGAVNISSGNVCLYSDITDEPETSNLPENITAYLNTRSASSIDNLTWKLSHESELFISHNSWLIIQSGDESIQMYRPDLSHSNPPIRWRSSAEDGDGTLINYYEDENGYYFELSGNGPYIYKYEPLNYVNRIRFMLTEIRIGDRNSANKLTLSYNNDYRLKSIKRPIGDDILISYGKNGLISSNSGSVSLNSIISKSAPTLRLDFDDSCCLKSITNELNQTYSYSYNQRHGSYLPNDYWLSEMTSPSLTYISGLGEVGLWSTLSNYGYYQITIISYDGTGVPETTVITSSVTNGTHNYAITTQTFDDIDYRYNTWGSFTDSDNIKTVVSYLTVSDLKYRKIDTETIGADIDFNGSAPIIAAYTYNTLENELLHAPIPRI